MNLVESLRIALRALSANKLRAMLTMLGIIIGVAAVIALLALGQGVQATVEEQIEGIGANLLIVFSGTFSGEAQRIQPLTYRESQALSDPLYAPSVAAVAPVIQRSATIVFGQRDGDASVVGCTADYSFVRNANVMSGRFIEDRDVSTRSRVVVLGYDVMVNLFPDTDPVGQTAKIRGVPFRVIGVMEKKGGGGFGPPEDRWVYIPLTTAAVRLFGTRTASGDFPVSEIYVAALDQENIDPAIEEVTLILREQHRLTYQDNDFTIVTQDDVLDVAGSIIGVLTIFLGAIAGISLLVGGIGIMNIMLVSVTERTREIGIRKAVGAKRRDILMQFLIEAVVLSVMGGLVGLTLGVLGARTVARLQPDLQAVLTPGIILMATGFSAAVGLFFGIYPAMRAARLHPIEALRYE
ncbi:MAG: ABC transporter permease [Chloroflexia bacterium]|nr:ABC transporter permease [Chloroflexia bacterium]